jgi:hypothetical protein
VADEGDLDVSWFAVDLVGNRELLQSMRVGVDETAPTVTGLPPTGCEIWPPNGKLVVVAEVVGEDTLSGVASLVVSVTANETLSAGDVVVDGGTVRVRADRAGRGHGRVYTVAATVTDKAGNVTVSTGQCTVPHDQGHGH